QSEHGGHDGHADEKCVAGDSDCQGEGEGFDGGVAGQQEAGEDGGHDHRGGDYYPGGGSAAGDDCVVRVSAARVVFADPGGQEHFVVHGQPKQHGHQDNGQEAGNRAGGGTERSGQPAPLEDGDGGAEAGAD